MPFRIWRVEWMQVLFPGLVWKIKDTPHVFLTFDDGPDPVATPKVLSVLDRFGVKATFFCVGQNVQKHPEIVREIKRAGHVIGNHTFQHENGWKTPATSYLNSIHTANTFIKSNLFRPPYGRINIRCIDPLKKDGFQIIMWTWLSKDYNRNISNERIISAAQRIKAGDILVFHDSHKTAGRIEELLTEIIPKIQSKQLTFSTFVNE